ncbi:hypothetical protein V5799_014392 [Amblyomma americanum]|uniref:Uncharacterized protein n=1 Tax=Amblyomma americanum TaxID=6943 RepID=A0AAQ4E375_AMBAM
MPLARKPQGFQGNKSHQRQGSARLDVQKILRRLKHGSDCSAAISREKSHPDIPSCSRDEYHSCRLSSSAQARRVAKFQWCTYLPSNRCMYTTAVPEQCPPVNRQEASSVTIENSVLLLREICFVKKQLATVIKIKKEIQKPLLMSASRCH